MLGGDMTIRVRAAMTILYEQWDHQARVLAPMLGSDVTVVTTGHELTEAVANNPDEAQVVLGPSTALTEALRAVCPGGGAVSVAIRDLVAKRFTTRSPRPQPRRPRALVGRRSGTRKG
jgi:hypothetical protein